MKKVIFDCDNTMGIHGCDVDDGLALLYLMGEANIQLEAVTLTYGNSSIEKVCKATKNLFSNFNITFPLLKGAGKGENRLSDASIFLAEAVQKYPGEITVLATGALTNLYGAQLYDANFLKNVREIVVMGGITQPLVVGGRQVKELNFSCDAEATRAVLLSEAPVTILNGHTTKQAVFSEDDMSLLMESNHKGFQDVKRYIKKWINVRELKEGIRAFCNWDVAAALYLTYPELFQEKNVYLEQQQPLLHQGMLTIGQKGKLIAMPEKIMDLEKFNHIFAQGVNQFVLECTEGKDEVISSL